MFMFTLQNTSSSYFINILELVPVDNFFDFLYFNLL